MLGDIAQEVFSTKEKCHVNLPVNACTILCECVEAVGRSGHQQCGATGFQRQ